MHKDKKADGGKVHFVLMKEISDVTVYELTVDEVIRLLK
jgi:3-dehydroquinate synthetase